MKVKGKKGVRLPEVTSQTLSYALHSIDLSNNGCYDTHTRLRLDNGFGDYNMRLFRPKDRKKYLKSIPTAFTPNIQRLLYQAPSQDPVEMRLATEHNQQISRILKKPKEHYIQKLQKEHQEQQRSSDDSQEFVKGIDRQVRAYGEQLSFNYLPSHQADHWFNVLDRSHAYRPPSPLTPLPAASVTATPIRPRKKPRHIFLSDDKTFSLPRR